MSEIFNSVAIPVLITAAIDVLLFAWMHFTPEGMAFGAMVADKLGMTAHVVASAGLTEATTMAGEAVLAF